MAPSSHHREVGSMFFRNVGTPKSQYKTSQPKRPKYEKSGGSSLGRKIVEVLNDRVFHGKLLSFIRKHRKKTNIYHKYDNKNKAAGAQTFDVVLIWGHTEL
jgi:hypothetical protein